MRSRRRRIHPQDRYGCFSMGCVCLAGAMVLLGICKELGLIETKSRRRRGREIPVRVDLANGRSVPQTEPREPAPQGQDAVESVVVVPIGPAGEPLAEGRRTFPVDAVCVGCGFMPSNDISRPLGCRHRFPVAFHLRLGDP